MPADYADLDTRHLGSIYEGLLEHEFRIAGPEGVAAVSEDGGQVWKSGDEVSVADAVEVVEEGGLYVVNDEGERKATGAYYTPDYVVTYIVEETVDPLIDEIDADLREQGFEPSDREYFVEFWQEIKDLTVLDPAMGSGHFLTKATGYLTEQVMEVVREQEIQSYDEQYIRREISKECIYGVDLNGMAVELAKLSMWLETLAADQPLAFLDHHLKAGNSLVGSDITEVLSDDNGDDDTGQITLTQAFARVRQDTLEHVMELMADLLAYDNETLEDVKSMEELYDEIRDDPLYNRLFELANVHTAEEFGVDVPEDAYEQMASAIEDESDWEAIRGEDWFISAQATADEQDFFHWELEFPEVFFDAEGEKMDAAGFDAVVGNPPYVRIHRIGHSQADYIQNKFETTSQKTDLSLPFLELGVRLDSRKGSAAFISTSQWVSTDYGETAREFFSYGTVSKIVDFGTLPVFKNVSTYPAIFVLNSSNTDTLQYLEVGSKSELNHEGLANITARPLGYDRFSEEAWVFDGLDLRTTLNSTDGTDPISDYGGFKIGALTGDDDVFVVDQETIDANSIESEMLLPYAHRGEEVSRFGTVEPEARVIYPYNEGVDGESELIEEELLQSQYPNAHSYLKSHQDSLSERQDSRRYYAEGEDWYCFLRPGRFDYANPEKLIMKGVATEATVGYLGPETLFSGANCPGFIPDEEKYTGYFISLLNSNLISQYLIQVCPAKMQGYTRFNANNLNEVPVIIPRSIDWEEVRTEVESVVSDTDTPLGRLDDTEYKQREVYPVFLDVLAGRQREQVDKRDLLETDLRVHLGEYRSTDKLTNIGLIQPQKSSKLDYTKEDYKNLRVGTARVDRESPNTVLIEATARYKPDDEDAYETDRWGYTETEYLPAFRITDLMEREADLIEHFVPVAVDEAGGFANFRETATKTNSLIDRLKAIELPDVDDVADDLENYLETKERAEELDAKIEQTDQLIDEIVYELYGLTDEEIEIIEEAVSE
ncbi:MAG: N-6 DNA methylase [Halorubrum sp.]